LTDYNAGSQDFRIKTEEYGTWANSMHFAYPDDLLSYSATEAWLGSLCILLGLRTAWGRGKLSEPLTIVEVCRVICVLVIVAPISVS
jgi:hypothetical protein